MTGYNRWSVEITTYHKNTDVKKGHFNHVINGALELSTIMVELTAKDTTCITYEDFSLLQNDSLLLLSIMLPKNTT